MSVAAELNPPNKEVHSGRKILGPAGNRVVRVPSPCRKPSNKQKPVHKMADSVVQKNDSVDSTCSSGSSSSSSSSARRWNDKQVVKKCVSKVASTRNFGRCEWITPYSDPIYISFHDKEWGVPVHDDNKLFELLCFSMLLADHSWISILSKRDVFRKLLNGFNLATVAEISEENISSIVISSRSLLSETRLRAVIDNAKHILEEITHNNLQVQKEFESFSKYCWRFVNNKPQKNGFRHQRQVPVKTPKAELISKDLLRRGLRCVGPTVVYSFLQVAGMVNDHLTTCFRHEHCC